MSNLSYLDFLKNGIASKNLSVGVIGLGYVGLPTAIQLHSKGFKIFGIDTSKKVVQSLRNNISHISEEVNLIIPSDNRWKIDDSYDNIPQCDIIIICVPTPVNSNFQPDLSRVNSAFKSISDSMGKNKTVTIILESTVQPGTTMNCFEKYVAQKNKDYILLAYCPERVSPGDSYYDLTKVNRVVGSNEKLLTPILSDFYGCITDAKVLPVKSIEVAEAAKLVENTQRDIDIAFTNELAMLMPRLGLDVEDVLEAASTKWNFHRHTPGIGVGGHCIPIDPHYYIEIAKKHNIISNLSPHARLLNESMPKYAAAEILKICDLKSAPRILILGYSYKPNIGDVRETPVAPLITNLSKFGAKIFVWEPYMDELTSMENSELITDPYELNNIDCIVIGTAHNCVLTLDWKLLKKIMNTPILYDGRRCLKSTAMSNYGWKYYAIGRPNEVIN